MENNDKKVIDISGIPLFEFEFENCIAQYWTFQNLQSLHLNSSNLKKFSFKDLPKSLLEISVNNNILTEFDWTYVPPNLQKLNIGYNKLKKFSFDGAPKTLQILELHMNCLSELDWTNVPPNLTRIYLSGNNISEFSFKNSPKKLEYLDLFGNNLSEWSWKECPLNLKTINLSFNKFKKFSFKECDSTLNLNNLEFVEVCLEEINFVNCPSNLNYINWYNEELCEYRESLSFYKEMSTRLLPITSSILEFHSKNGTLVEKDPQEIYFVTGNKQKFKEFSMIMGDYIKKYNITHRDLDIEEIQGSPIEIVKNKCLKASKILNRSVIVEDISLCFNCLDGLPGPYIKHFLKKLGVQKLSEMVLKYADHSAQALCIYAYYNINTKNLKVFYGVSFGTIVSPKLCSNDYNDLTLGWDPIFIPENYTDTFATIPIETKNKISHRSIAINNMKSWMKSNM